MAKNDVLPGAEAFYFEGSEVGCVVSHGFTGTTQSMRFLGEYLSKEGGLTVIGPRLTGHGSTPEEMATATAEDWIRDIERAAENLRPRCSKVFITGLSMGGTLTLYMAAMHPDIFLGAAPINAAIFLENPDFAALAFSPKAPSTIPGVSADIKKPGVFELAYPVIPVPCLRQLYVLVTVTRELLPQVLCPTLVFQAREDHVVKPENAPFIMERLGAKDKKLVWLDESYHVSTLDNDKEFIAREILKFIRAHL